MAKRNIDWQERFWANVQKTETCWLWTGTIDRHGYGSLSIENHPQKAHRLSYFLHTGEVLDGLFVCHSCDIRHCVNPDHLYAGTHAENLRDMTARDRHTNVRIYEPAKTPKRTKPTEAERFWAKVDKSGDCWLWVGASNKDGYGTFRLEGKTAGAHRLAFSFTFGQIGAGMQVCHRCDNPACCNPEHLFLGTRDVNIADRHSKGRSRGPSRETHRSTKLTAVQLDEIRALYATGGHSLRKLGAMYGVDYTHISRIIRNKPPG